MWFGQCPNDFLCYMCRHIRAVDIRNDEHELIATKAGDRILFSEKRLQSCGDTAQQQISDPVTEGVIDHFESIEVQEQKRYLPPHVDAPQQAPEQAGFAEDGGSAVRSARHAGGSI